MVGGVLVGEGRHHYLVLLLVHYEDESVRYHLSLESSQSLPLFLSFLLAESLSLNLFETLPCSSGNNLTLPHYKAQQMEGTHGLRSSVLAVDGAMVNTAQGRCV